MQTSIEKKIGSVADWRHFSAHVLNIMFSFSTCSKSEKYQIFSASSFFLRCTLFLLYMRYVLFKFLFRFSFHSPSQPRKVWLSFYSLFVFIFCTNCCYALNSKSVKANNKSETKWLF